MKAGDNYSSCPVQFPRLAKTYSLHDCWVINLEDQGGYAGKRTLDGVGLVSPRCSSHT